MLKSTHKRFLLGPIVLSMVMALGLATAAAAATSVTGAAKGPKIGGNITFGGTSIPTPLDFTQSGFSGPGNPNQLEEFGSLFVNPLKPGGAFVPDLAQSYSFSKHATVFTVTLKPGLHFSDGSPVTASDLAWQWGTSRDQLAVAYPLQYLTTVTNIKTIGKLTVQVTFSQPDAVFISDIASEPVGLVESPTSLQAEGQATFDLIPVGAGAYKVQTNNGSQLVLARNPSYWDAKHIYISTQTTIITGADPTSNYDDLETGVVSALGEQGATASPTIIQEALANPNFSHHATPNYNLIVMPINTMAPPFNNQSAREALDYCFNRQTLTQYQTAGYASPAYVFGGPAVFWYPVDPKTGRTSIPDAQKLLPYQFNPTQGTSIVQSLGGLKFNFSVLNLSSTYITLATAIAEQWQSNCGIQATITPIAANVYNTQVTQGSYQIGFNPTGAQFDPRLVVTYINATSSLNLFGFRDPVVQDALTKSFADTSPVALKKDWTTIWTQMDKDAVLIPVMSSPTYELTSKCINGIDYNYGINFQNAWLTCNPAIAPS